MNTKEIPSKRQGKNTAGRQSLEEMWKRVSSAGSKTGMPQSEHIWKEQWDSGIVRNLRCCILCLGYVQLAVCGFSKLGEHAKFPPGWICERWETDF